MKGASHLKLKHFKIWFFGRKVEILINFNLLNEACVLNFFVNTVEGIDRICNFLTIEEKT